MNRPILSAAVTAAALASLASAQVGRITLDIDIEAPTASNGHLGCAVLVDASGNKRIFTTNRGLGATTTAPHHVNEWDVNGNLLNTFPQSANTSASAWGWRDGANDGTSLIFGSEAGIEVVDPTGMPVNTLNAAAGPQPITQPIVATGTGGGPGTHRGIAFDPLGNGGGGTLFVGDFGGDILEIDLQGNILVRYPNTDSWSVYGLAYDFPTQTLWINSTPNQGTIKQYTVDRNGAALTPTGLELSRGAGGAQGGLDLVRGGFDGRDCGYDLLGLDQAGPDRVFGYRVELWNGYDPRGEPQLLAGFDGGNFGTRIEVPPAASTLEVDLAGAAGQTYFLFLDVIGDPPRPIGPIIGFRSAWELSHPRPNGGYFGAQVSGSPFSLPAAAFTAAPPGASVEWQAIVIDPNVPVGPACGLRLPLAATDYAEHVNLGPSTGTVVQAQGSNSFNSDITSGFFSVTAGPAITANDPIVEVTFDFGSSSNPTAASTVFDLDQTGMANTFWEGNQGGCMGTYRNMSDVTAGLDYANVNNNVIGTTTCAGSVAHCVGTSAASSNILTWHFTGGQFINGVTFEFDCDTDGGAGITGDAMAGMVATIKLSSGLTFSRELQVDPNVAATASITL